MILSLQYYAFGLVLGCDFTKPITLQTCTSLCLPMGRRGAKNNPSSRSALSIVGEMSEREGQVSKGH